jgi:hypothetical protein
LLKQNAWWRWLRAYNLLVLAALAFYSLPWLERDDDPQVGLHTTSTKQCCCVLMHHPSVCVRVRNQGYASVIGFEKMEVGQLSTWSDTIIFCLLALQGYVRRRGRIGERIGDCPH